MKNLLLNSFLQKKMVFKKSVSFGAIIFCLSVLLGLSSSCASQKSGLNNAVHYPDSIPIIHEPNTPTPKSPQPKISKKRHKYSVKNLS